ncbi:hypothetical protein C0992_008765 [Termitomyces sp. T32_za158]|nr:hypothetical protein C0992_008765 [Termitomyces sp. T32_za158]
MSALPASHYARIALADSADLAAHARPSWVGDLVKVLHSLSVPRSSPVPVPFEWDDLWEADRIAQVIDNVRASSDAGLRHIITTSPKLSLLRMRLMASGSEKISEFRHYLHITTPAHRKAFTRLIVSNHGLAVESFRYTHRYRTQPVPRQWRLCRFCMTDVEDELHALLMCEGSEELIQTRARFRQVLRNIDNDVGASWGIVPPSDFLLALLTSKRCASAFGRFIYQVFSIFDASEQYTPLAEHTQ